MKNWAGRCFRWGSGWLHRRSFCGRTLPLRIEDLRLDVLNGLSTLNGEPPSQVQRMMRHQHYTTTEIYGEEVQKLLEGADDAVTQI